MENPNLVALELVDEAIDFAEELNVGVRHLENDAAVLDFGVDGRGGVEAGLLLAEVATGGLATIQARPGTVDGAARTRIDLATDHPRLSLLACQRPGWPLEVEETTVLGRGPAQLLRAGGHDGPDAGDPGFGEADFAVLIVESARLPGEDLVDAVAAETGVPASGVFVLVAPAASVAGGVAAAARTAERAATRLVDAGGHAPESVRSVTASAPVAPIAGSESEARARSAAAVGYGGRAHLVVEGDVEDPAGLVFGGDGGGDGDRLPAPAQVTVDVVGGPTHVAGSVDEEHLAEQLGQ